MSTERPDGTQEQVSTKSRQVSSKSGRYSSVSPGRVAAGKRLHELGLAGLGGRRPTHGRRALAELLKRGLEEGSPIAALQREAEGAYLGDLGGAEQASSMDKGLVRRLAVLDLDLALLLAQRDGAARLSKEQASRLSQDLARNSSSYAGLVKVLGGPSRRPRPTDGQIVVRRWSEPTEAPKQGTQQEGGQ